MNILDKIIQHKRLEVERDRHSVSIQALEASALYDRDRLSMKDSLRQVDSSGIIAEFKRKSPSKGMINALAEIGETTKGYEIAGVAGLSVLTDHEFFAGTREDLEMARRSTSIPILRKDFMIDEYQIVAARAMGADVILLIAACLSATEIQKLAEFAHKLGLEVLMEVHNREELDMGMNDFIDLVGVNNRNLKDFTVNINTSLELSDHIPEECVKVVESGLSSPAEILQLREAGFQGFLMGQRFMEYTVPADACQDFLNSLRSAIQQRSYNMQ